jgi:hypothetical protein
VIFLLEQNLINFIANHFGLGFSVPSKYFRVFTFACVDAFILVTDVGFKDVTVDFELNLSFAEDDEVVVVFGEGGCFAAFILNKEERLPVGHRCNKTLVRIGDIV